MQHEQIAIEQIDDIVVVKLQGQFIGGDETEALRQVIGQFAAKPQTLMVLDATGVEYANSSFLSVLLAAHTATTRHAGKFCVVGLNGIVLEVIRVTSMDKVLMICKTKEEAIEQLRIDS
ncbi:MAG: STAS domain-containing protein [Ignavibacteria bacterium]|nr:STAS domain-containing protein [Ignavibacteria bacterium]